VVVAVDALSVRIISQGPVPGGTFIVRPTGGADLTPRGIEVDLDGMGNAAITYLRGEGGGTLPSLSFTVEPGEVERLQIEARAGHTLCTWTAELHLLADGQRKTVEIDNNGQPFETAGRDGRPMYAWMDGAWRPFP
jgi:hypothetical protein